MKKLNSLYFSQRVQQLLAQMAAAAATLVVAPMGYGKTLAVNYFLQSRELKGDVVVRQSIYGAGQEAFWQGVQRAWSALPLGAALAQQAMPVDTNSRALILELFAKQLPIKDCYWFIDEAGFPQLHLLLVSRGQIFTQAQRISLGQQVLYIDKQDLALRRSELTEYSQHCGLALSAKLLDALHEACEG